MHSLPHRWFSLLGAWTLVWCLSTGAAGQQLIDDGQSLAPVAAQSEDDEAEDDEAAVSERNIVLSEEDQRKLAELWDEHQKKSQSNRPTVKVFGRMHLETLAFPRASDGIDQFENPVTGSDVEDRIQFRRMRIGAEGKILQNGLYRLEFDLGNPSRTTFRDVYVGFEELPLFQTLLIGSQKRPLGLDAWNSNQHVVFFERPLAVNAFNPNFRRVGVQSYGHSDDSLLNWQTGVFELQDVKGIGQDLGDPLHFSFNGRIAGTLWYDQHANGRNYLHAGVSDMYANSLPTPNPSGNNGDLASFSARPELRTTSSWIDTGTILGANHFNVTGLESVLNLGSLQLQGEYLVTSVNRTFADKLQFEGGYVQAAYFLTGESMPWDRDMGRLARPVPASPLQVSRKECRRGWGAIQVAARWSYLSLTDKDIRGGRQEDWTFGTNWYWTAHSKLMFNLVDGRIYDRQAVNGLSQGKFTGVGLRVLMDF